VPVANRVACGRSSVSLLFSCSWCLSSLVHFLSGDGNRPRCQRCQRSSRPCSWSDGVRRSPRTVASSNQHRQSATSPDVCGQASVDVLISRSVEYVSTSDPTKALEDPRVAHIFRSYIDNLAGWYDLNDRRRHFTNIVPILARKNALLLSAILAFAAASQSSSSGSTLLKDLADAYHLESVRKLLALMKHPDEFRTGETLAAICLLRSYEIISRKYDHYHRMHICQLML
jgi:hypothetical protein